MNFPAETQPNIDAGVFVNTTAYGKGKENKRKSQGFERLFGHAVLRLWSELPREVQEKLFETAIPFDPIAIFLHDRHPRTAHPPKPTQLA
jgi:hypothetical protein